MRWNQKKFSDDVNKLKAEARDNLRKELRIAKQMLRKDPGHIEYMRAERALREAKALLEKARERLNRASPGESKAAAEVEAIENALYRMRED